MTEETDICIFFTLHGDEDKSATLQTINVLKATINQLVSLMPHALKMDGCLNCSVKV